MHVQNHLNAIISLSTIGPISDRNAGLKHFTSRITSVKNWTETLLSLSSQAFERVAGGLSLWSVVLDLLHTPWFNVPWLTWPCWKAPSQGWVCQTLILRPKGEQSVKTSSDFTWLPVTSIDQEHRETMCEKIRETIFECRARMRNDAEENDTWKKKHSKITPP